ncbi:MAG TPA: hypothetical protein VFF52_14400 [Isosphaeraceae bacterium]|nr:hypothetical protein [Isosphaeraceae bacterium]
MNATKSIASPGFRGCGSWVVLGIGLVALGWSLDAIAAAADGQPARLDLRRAVVVAPPGLSGPERKAVTMLVEEVARRSRLDWEVRSSWPEGAARPVVLVGSVAAVTPMASRLAGVPEAAAVAGRPEGFRIWTQEHGPAVIVLGNDARGVLFGVGRLLRELRMERDRVGLPAAFQIASAPRYPVRGHQMGYRPKTNSYDGWDIPQWEQAIRDLAVFGTNIVELIPPRSDDAPDSPHFPRPPMEMMITLSRLLDEYGLDVGIWYPAIEGDYGDSHVVQATLAAWDDVFRKLPRVDAVFVPGGDPGHSRPRDLMPFLERAAEVLHRSHPKAGIWVSTQGFDRSWHEEFVAIVRTRPPWLSGLVYGPHTRADLDALRAALPEHTPIRLYPDITHTIKCQFPVADWDLAFYLTEGREPINPRPEAYRTIVRAMVPETIGFVSYSEGCNDDVNKVVWSCLGWDPDARTIDILREYSRYFLGARWADRFAQGLLALERNWEGPLLGNPAIDVTLQQFQDMEQAANPRERANWRFQQALYRAYYDGYLKDRLRYETGLEERALETLGRARELGSILAMDRAETLLDRAVTDPIATARRARVGELAAALFQSIHMQLSVTRYQAIGEERGANLDAIDAPLNNRVWLKQRFAAIRALPSEPDRLAALAAMVRRADPGPGGFYDAPGDPRRRPHLVPGPGLQRDPMLRLTRIGFHKRPDWPLFWCRFAESLYDAPLRMRYSDLDPEAAYRVRVVYSGDRFDTRVRLTADGQVVHPLLPKPDPVRPVEFDVPRGATADGTLELVWTQEPGRGGNGRGCQVAEVWLIRAREP